MVNFIKNRVVNIAGWSGFRFLDITKYLHLIELKKTDGSRLTRHRVCQCHMVGVGNQNQIVLLGKGVGHQHKV